MYSLGAKRNTLETFQRGRSPRPYKLPKLSGKLLLVHGLFGLAGLFLCSTRCAHESQRTNRIAR